jgi:DNA-binding transcriptional LysR family regulator
MDTEALRWFQQVADGVTVTQVGELYWVTQSGVSRGLARLETDVGTPLLRRSGRVLRLTHAGAVFKRYVDAALHELDDGLAAVGQLVDPESGTVAVAYQLSLGTWLVPHLVAGFRVANPGVHFVLQQARDELTSSVLGRGTVDLEITALRPTDRTVRWHRLLSEPLCLAVPAEHPLAAGDGVRLAEVAGEDFVALRPTSLLRRQTTELCEHAGFAPTVAFEGDDVPTVRGFVAAGLGVAILPAPRAGSVDGPGSAVRHLPITDGGASREVGLAWSTERRLLPAAEAFRTHVLARAAARDIPPVAAEPVASGVGRASPSDPVATPRRGGATRRR